MDIKEIEQSVFKKIISNPKKLGEHLNKVSWDDFSHPVMRDVIYSLSQNGYTAHFLPTKTTFEVLLRDKIKDKSKLTTTAMILEKWGAKKLDPRDLDIELGEIRRERMCARLINVIQQNLPRIEPGTVDQVYDDLIKQLICIPLAAGSKYATTNVHDVHDDINERLSMYFESQKKKFPCGLKAFDRVIGGFAPGEFIVLTAGTGQGKSALMLWWANFFNQSGANVAYISIEMSYEECMERYHAMITSQSMYKIRNKLMSDEEQFNYHLKLVKNSLDKKAQAGFEKEALKILDQSTSKELINLANDLPKRKSKMFFFDMPKGCTPDRIEREISRLSMKTPIHVVFIDYINIMESNNRSRDWREQANIAEDLKKMARKMKTLVFTGSQLKTDSMEKGADVTTDNIKYARAIAENADWVIGFNRTQSDIDMKLIRLNLAKHRFSADATAALEVDFETMSFKDLGDAPVATGEFGVDKEKADPFMNH